jgi:hypothetical protein
VTFVLPYGSKFDSDLHWHESHTEYFSVSQGVMRVTLEVDSGKLVTTFIGPNSGVVEVPKNRRHRLRRGDQGIEWKRLKGNLSWMDEAEFREGGKITDEDWEAEARGQEWTSPQDGRKEAFFRNLAGVVGEKRKGGIWTVWENVLVLMGVLVVFREFDNWPAFLGGRWRILEWILSHTVLWVVGVLGGLLGLKGEYEEYTPVELRELVTGQEGGKGKKGL